MVRAAAVALALAVAAGSVAASPAKSPSPPPTFGAMKPVPGPVPVATELAPERAATTAGARLLARVAAVDAGLIDSTYQPRTQVDERAGVYRWDCSGMTTWFLRRAAPKARAAIASARPVARDYYHAIRRAPVGRARRGWQRLAHVSDARPGDLFAFLRSPLSTSKITGHVGVIVSRPVPVPAWSGAYLVRVADSTRGGHGDDRRAFDHDGGFGIGTLLFVTDDTGTVVYYGWFGLDSPGLIPTTVLFGRVTA